MSSYQEWERDVEKLVTCAEAQKRKEQQMKELKAFYTSLRRFRGSVAEYERHVGYEVEIVSDHALFRFHEYQWDENSFFPDNAPFNLMKLLKDQGVEALVNYCSFHPLEMTLHEEIGLPVKKRDVLSNR